MEVSYCFFSDENDEYYQLKLSVAIGEHENNAYNLGNIRQRKTPEKVNGSSLAGAPLSGSP